MFRKISTQTIALIFLCMSITFGETNKEKGTWLSALLVNLMLEKAPKDNFIGPVKSFKAETIKKFTGTKCPDNFGGIETFGSSLDFKLDCKLDMYFFGLPYPMTGEVGQRMECPESTKLSAIKNYIVLFNKTNKSSPITHFMVVPKTAIKDSQIHSKYISVINDCDNKYLLDRITSVTFSQSRYNNSGFPSVFSGAYTYQNITEDDKMSRQAKKDSITNGVAIDGWVIFFTGTPSFINDPNGVFEADCYKLKQ